MDYGKFKYQSQKKAAEAKKKQKVIGVKEIKMRPNIDTHDYEVKLKNMKIVLDCANGAAYKSAPKMIKSLGAKVIIIGNKPNGFNINDNCGSTFPNKLQRYVKKHKAHLLSLIHI